MYADVNGVKLFFDIEGKEYVPDGPVLRKRPVCFVLHGGPGGDHTHFLPAISALTDTMLFFEEENSTCEARIVLLPSFTTSSELVCAPKSSRSKPG